MACRPGDRRTDPTGETCSPAELLLPRPAEEYQTSRMDHPIVSGPSRHLPGERRSKRIGARLERTPARVPKTSGHDGIDLKPRRLARVLRSFPNGHPQRRQRKPWPTSGTSTPGVLPGHLRRLNMRLAALRLASRCSRRPGEFNCAADQRTSAQPAPIEEDDQPTDPAPDPGW